MDNLVAGLLVLIIAQLGEMRFRLWRIREEQDRIEDRLKALEKRAGIILSFLVAMSLGGCMSTETRTNKQTTVTVEALPADNGGWVLQGRAVTDSGRRTEFKTDIPQALIRAAAAVPPPVDIGGIIGGGGAVLATLMSAAAVRERLKRKRLEEKA